MVDCSNSPDVAKTDRGALGTVVRGGVSRPVNLLHSGPFCWYTTILPSSWSSRCAPNPWELDAQSACCPWLYSTNFHPPAFLQMTLPNLSYLLPKSLAKARHQIDIRRDFHRSASRGQNVQRVKPAAVRRKAMLHSPVNLVLLAARESMEASKLLRGDPSRQLQGAIGILLLLVYLLPRITSRCIAPSTSWRLRSF